MLAQWKFLNVLLLSCFVLSCARQNDSATNDLKLVAVTHSTATLTPLLQVRCGQYASSPLSKLACDTTAFTFMTRLDFGTPKGKPPFERIDQKAIIHGVAAFRGIMRDEIQSGRAQHFLEIFGRELLQTKGRVSVWSSALLAANGSHTDALKYLGLFLQDSTAQMHVYYMKSVFGADHPVVHLVSSILRFLIINQDRIDFYPDGVSSSRKLWYHFYVPAYAAFLAQNRQTKQKMESFVAHLFNAEYELQDHLIFNKKDKEKNSGLLAKLNSVIELMTEAHKRVVGSWANIDLNKNQEMLQDLYLGYAGGHWSISGTESLLDEAHFIQQFSDDPQSFQKFLFEKN
jgi:hypothetical protein